MIERKIRVLVVKPGVNGHDRGAKVVARSCPQEDVDVVCLSIFSGTHLK